MKSVTRHPHQNTCFVLSLNHSGVFLACFAIQILSTKTIGRKCTTSACGGQLRHWYGNDYNKDLSDHCRKRTHPRTTIGVHRVIQNPPHGRMLQPVRDTKQPPRCCRGLTGHPLPPHRQDYMAALQRERDAFCHMWSTYANAPSDGRDRGSCPILGGPSMSRL